VWREEGDWEGNKIVRLCEGKRERRRRKRRKSEKKEGRITWENKVRKG
jgi:hypothetical protein